MSTSSRRRTFVRIALVTLAIAACTVLVYATHSWGNYHWARTSNPFTLKLGDNVNSTWDPILATTSSDWTTSFVLDTTIVAGSNTRPRNCKPKAGRIEVCNATYGANGWLGLAQIWITGAHITQAVTKVNDTYFNTSTYNITPWRNLVMCQEVGHTLGLDHQDEDFDNPNLNTCMDYTNNPSSNQHPNTHDYNMLESIYAHLDSTNTASMSVEQAAAAMPPAMRDLELDGPGQWGRLMRGSREQGHSTYELDFGGGRKVITHVFWARERGPEHHE